MKPRQVPRTPSRWKQGPAIDHLVFIRETARDAADDLLEMWRVGVDSLDSGLGSPNLDGSSGGTYEDDGSATGGIPKKVVAREKLAPASKTDPDDPSKKIHLPIESRKQVGWEEDPILVAFHGFFDCLSRGVTVMAELRSHAAVLRKLDPEVARKLVEDRVPERGKPCDNCGRWVSGPPGDPIRAGRCGTCYEYRRTHGGKDRSKEMIEEQVYRESA